MNALKSVPQTVTASGGGGGQKASGSTTSSSSSVLTVTGLAFQPKLFMWRNHNGTSDMGVYLYDYSTSTYWVWDNASAVPQMSRAMNTDGPTANGFVATVAQANNTYDWYAFAGW